MPDERQIVHIAEGFLRSADPLREAHRHQAGAQRLLHGLSHSEVGRQREAGDELGQPDPSLLAGQRGGPPAYSHASSVVGQAVDVKLLSGVSGDGELSTEHRDNCTADLDPRG